MRTNRLFVASGLLLAGVAGAQLPHDPVPTRIETAVYGVNDAARLEIDLFMAGARSPEIRVRGGQPDAMVLILGSTNRSMMQLPDGDFVLADPEVTLFGTFDGVGEFAVPIDVMTSDFNGQSAFFQGVQFRSGFDACTVSPGLRVTFFPGNLQPDLNYVTPPLTAILQKAIVTEATYGVLIQVDVPTRAYALAVEKVAAFDNGRTVVYVRLVRSVDAPPEMLPPGALPGDKLTNDGARLRKFVDLGSGVTRFVEVVVSSKPVSDQPVDYARAAWIDTVLPLLPSDRSFDRLWKAASDRLVVDRVRDSNR